jgi:uncharacterized membrane protein
MNYYYYAALCVILIGLGQVFLKLGAKNRKNVASLFLNPFTIIGYALFVIVTICTVLALEDIELKALYTIMSFSYILIIVFSKLFLGESISTNKIAATVLIVLGVVIFNL